MVYLLGQFILYWMDDRTFFCFLPVVTGCDCFLALDPRHNQCHFEKEVKNTGLTIIPTRLFINERGLAKLDIVLAKGKKLHDKRETIKDRDNKRALDRIKKDYR